MRELTGGAYFGAKTRTADTATDECKYTVAEIERVVRRAFELARARRKHVTHVDKANVLETSRLWRSTVTRIAADYPDVTLEHQLVDSMAMLLLTRPSAYDVIVTENLFGDILTDEAAALAGSLGLLPSASLGDGKAGLYEPIHGSAPGYRRQRPGQSARHDPVRGAAAAAFAGSGSRSGHDRSCSRCGDRKWRAHARSRRQREYERSRGSRAGAIEFDTTQGCSMSKSGPLTPTLSPGDKTAEGDGKLRLRSDVMKSGAGSRAGARDAVRDRARRGGDRQAAGRGRAYVVERFAVQFESARAGRTRRRRRARGRRHADRVQHDRSHRRHRDGYAGHARLAGQSRSDHRFDRAGGRRSFARRDGRAVRLRQDAFPPRRWRSRA